MIISDAALYAAAKRDLAVSIALAAGAGILLYVIFQLAGGNSWGWVVLPLAGAGLGVARFVRITRQLNGKYRHG